MIQGQGISSKMGFVTALIRTCSPILRQLFQKVGNFLEILRHQRSDYHINESLSYVENEGLPPGHCQILKQSYEEGRRYLRTKKPLNTIIKQKE